MDKRFFNLVLVLVMAVLFVACEKVTQDTPTNLGYCGKEENVTIVKARISTFKRFSEDDYRWMVCEVASVKYENGGFELSELNFPASISDEYLWAFSEKTIIEGVTISDIQAQIGLVSVDAYDSEGKPIGAFALGNDNWSVEYLYADRDFTEKGISEYGIVIDCFFKKGWNIRYQSSVEKIHTTQKPLNEVFKWHFTAICVN